ncbi:MAG: hypothetical protein J1F69_05780 [Clostridiales bacterium]|nr:hypothetical protein [Clostridiales bacterium]
MIARIKTDDGFYDSIVFAKLDGGFESKVLVFNREKTELKAIREYTAENHRVVRHVFIYNTELDGGWVKNGKAEGYGFILGLGGDGVFDGPITAADVIERCKALQTAVKSPEWFEIKTEADIEGLLSVAFNFHGSHVKSMYKRNEKLYIRFYTSWYCDILFELDGDPKTNLVKGYGQIVDNDPTSEILGCSVFIDGGFTYWVDEPNAAEKAHIDKIADYYFCAEKVKWKLLV